MNFVRALSCVHESRDQDQADALAGALGDLAGLVLTEQPLPPTPVLQSLDAPAGAAESGQRTPVCPRQSFFGFRNGSGAERATTRGAIATTAPD
ncbi:MAG: hypothetical protein QOD94_2077 [Alphaproteobacteria bacterium]|nr:hypothetical protein [Alphaproteobacteria bacterium]